MKNRWDYVCVLQNFLIVCVDRVAHVAITSDGDSKAALADAITADDKQVWFHPPAEEKSEKEQKRHDEMMAHPIFNRYFEELKRGSLNDELTARAFYEPKHVLEKRLWNHRVTNEFGEKIERPITDVEKRREDLLDLLKDGWGYVEAGSRSERGGSAYVRRKVRLMLMRGETGTRRKMWKKKDLERWSAEREARVASADGDDADVKALVASRRLSRKSLGVSEDAAAESKDGDAEAKPVVEPPPPANLKVLPKFVRALKNSKKEEDRAKAEEYLKLPKEELALAKKELWIDHMMKRKKKRERAAKLMLELEEEKADLELMRAAEAAGVFKKEYELNPRTRGRQHSDATASSSSAAADASEESADASAAEESADVSGAEESADAADASTERRRRRPNASEESADAADTSTKRRRRRPNAKQLMRTERWRAAKLKAKSNPEAA